MESLSERRTWSIDSHTQARANDLLLKPASRGQDKITLSLLGWCTVSRWCGRRRQAMATVVGARVAWRRRRFRISYGAARLRRAQEDNHQHRQRKQARQKHSAIPAGHHALSIRAIFYGSTLRLRQWTILQRLAGRRGTKWSAIIRGRVRRWRKRSVDAAFAYLYPSSEGRNEGPKLVSIYQ